MDLDKLLGSSSIQLLSKKQTKNWFEFVIWIKLLRLSSLVWSLQALLQDFFALGFLSIYYRELDVNQGASYGFVLTVYTSLNCQAQPQFQLQLGAELVIFSTNPTTHPPGQVFSGILQHCTLKANCFADENTTIKF